MGDNMYQCIYCGNRTDDKNSPCKGCGSEEFKKYEEEKPTVITRVSQGGYTLKINYDELNKEQKKKLKLFFKMFIIVFILNIGVLIFARKYLGAYIKIPLIMVGSCALISLLIMPKLLNRYNVAKKSKYKYLANHGVLIKKLKYRVIHRDLSNHNYKICFLEVNYEDKDGNIIKLKSHPFYDDKFPSDRVDLLIDPNDYTNYYIDFNIY